MVLAAVRAPVSSRRQYSASRLVSLSSDDILPSPLPPENTCAVLGFRDVN
jgi:hypothetical protein